MGFHDKQEQVEINTTECTEDTTTKNQQELKKEKKNELDTYMAIILYYDDSVMQ